MKVAVALARDREYAVALLYVVVVYGSLVSRVSLAVGFLIAVLGQWSPDTRLWAVSVLLLILSVVLAAFNLGTLVGETGGSAAAHADHARYKATR